MQLFQLFSILLFGQMALAQQSPIPEGVFYHKDQEGEHSLLMQDGYFMHAVYLMDQKSFKYSEGGTYQVKGNTLVQRLEFSTRAPEMVGQERSFQLGINKQVMTWQHAGGSTQWQRVDGGNSGLAGNWRITGRKEGDSLRSIQPGPRKTLKILSGTRFQWAAINTATREFFGTGGGTYTFTNGTYTEHIEFFSRDSSRVGASLSFKGEVKGKDWHHSGTSSAGKPIYEIWSREK